MRTFRLGIAGGKVLSRACFSLLVISNIYFSSCEDDLDRGRISANIFFTPEIRAYWDLLIRSMASTEVPQDSVASLQGGYPLFLSYYRSFNSQRGGGNGSEDSCHVCNDKQYTRLF